MAKYIITYGHARLTDCENKVLKTVDSKKELYKFLKNYLKKNIDKDIPDENWGLNYIPPGMMTQLTPDYKKAFGEYIKLAKAKKAKNYLVYAYLGSYPSRQEEYTMLEVWEIN